MAIGHPGVLVGLLQADFALALAGAQVLQVFGKFTHQVAAGNPDTGSDTVCCAWGWAMVRVT